MQFRGGMNELMRERDLAAVPRYIAHREALRLEPLLHLGDIRVCRAELGAKLVRRKPLVELRRGRVLLCRSQRVQRVLLRGAAAEDDCHLLQLGRARHPAGIVGRLRKRGLSARQRGADGVINWSQNPSLGFLSSGR